MIETIIPACFIKPPLMQEGKLKKLVRKVREAVAPIHALVRYDTAHGKWAVLDPQTLNPVRHFEYGVMTQVIFQTTRLPSYGCGPGDWAGIAEGGLIGESWGD